MLGDVHIAEPARRGFAVRGIEQTIRENCPRLPAREYRKDHGMVDMVLHRHELRATLAACRCSQARLRRRPQPEA